MLWFPLTPSQSHLSLIPSLWINAITESMFIQYTSIKFISTLLVGIICYRFFFFLLYNSFSGVLFLFYFICCVTYYYNFLHKICIVKYLLLAIILLFHFHSPCLLYLIHNTICFTYMSASAAWVELYYYKSKNGCMCMYLPAFAWYGYL